MQSLKLDLSGNVQDVETWLADNAEYVTEPNGGGFVRMGSVPIQPKHLGAFWNPALRTCGGWGCDTPGGCAEVGVGALRIRSYQASYPSRTPTVPEPTACAARCHHDDAYCDNCDRLVGLPSVHVIDVDRRPAGLVVEVESPQR